MINMEMIDEYSLKMIEDIDSKYNPLNIIDGHIYDLDETEKFLDDDKIDLVEFRVLNCCSSDKSLNILMTGSLSSKILIPNVPDDAYVTNIDALLNAFYSLYKKFPNYHFDKLLEAGLYSTSIDYDFYPYLYEVVLKQLSNEKNNISPFQLTDFNVFNNLKFMLQFPDIVEHLKGTALSKYDSTPRYDYYVSCEPTLNEKGVSVFN